MHCFDEAYDKDMMSVDPKLTALFKRLVLALPYNGRCAEMAILLSK
jgi:hypothetical protein